MARDMTVAVRIEADTGAAQAGVERVARQLRVLQGAADAAARQAQDLGAALQRAASVRLDRAREVLGIRGTRDIQRDIQLVEAAYRRLAAAAAVPADELARAGAAMRRRLAELREELRGGTDAASGLARAWQGVVAALGAWSLAGAAGQVVSMAEAMTRLQARLELTEGSAAGAAQAMEAIYRIAQDTATPVEAVADGYVNFSRSLSRLGASQEQVVRFSEAVAKALRLSGASASQAGLVMYQLGQALDSGRLAGDEFRSVAEQGGRVLDYLAEALGVSRGQLRAMSEEGRLTARELLRLGDVAGRIGEDYARGVPRTLGDAWTRLANAAARLASQSTALRGALTAVAQAVEWVGQRLDAVVTGVAAVGLGVLVARAGGLAAALTGVAQAAAAAGVALAAMARAHPVLLALSVVAAGVVALWDRLPGQAEEAAQSMADAAAQALEAAERRGAGMADALRQRLDGIAQALEAARQRVQEGVQAATQAYAAQARVVEETARAEAEAIARRYQAERAELEQTRTHAVARAQEDARLVVASVQEQLAVAEAAAARRMALVDQEAALRRSALAAMTGDERARAAASADIELRALEGRRAILAQTVSEYRRHLDQLTADHRAHVQAVLAAERERDLARLSGEERIRELRRQLMDEYAAHQDRLRQIDEYTSRARVALAEGDAERAMDWARRAEGLIGQTARAVESGGRVLVTEQQAVTEAIARQTEVMQVQVRAHELRAQAARTAAQAEAAALGQAQAALAAYEGQLREAAQALDVQASIAVSLDTSQVEAGIQELQALVAQQRVLLEVQTNLDALMDRVRALRAALEQDTSSAHTVRDNAAEVQRHLDALDGQTTHSTHIIHVRRVEAHATGGLVGLAAAAWRRVTGRVTGPGTSTSDSIPALLSAGEYVVRAAAVRRYGLALLEALNAGRLPVPRYATGGLVERPASRETITWVIRAGEAEAPVQVVGQDSRQALHALTRELQRVGLLRG